jgi:hypothetical protein
MYSPLPVCGSHAFSSTLFLRRLKRVEPSEHALIAFPSGWFAGFG